VEVQICLSFDFGDDVGVEGVERVEALGIEFDG